MERKRAKILKGIYLKIFFIIFLREKKNHLYVCLKVLRLDRSNKVVQPTMTIIDVPRDDSA